jgi:hypothetical protein
MIFIEERIPTGIGQTVDGADRDRRVDETGVFWIRKERVTKNSMSGYRCCRLVSIKRVQQGKREGKRERKGESKGAEQKLESLPNAE